MLILEERFDRMEFDGYLNKKDSILKVSQIESIKDNLKEFQNSSIIMESCYIYDSVDSSSFIEESKSNINKIKGKESIEIKEDELKIVEFKKIIGKHKNSADFIRVLENNYFISGGIDNKMIIYSPKYIKIKSKELEGIIYNINKTKILDRDIELIVSSDDKVYVIKFDENYYTFKFYKEINGYKFCFEFNKYNYILGDKSGCYLAYDLFSTIIDSKRKMLITNKFYNSAIQISKNLIALTSNSILPNGEDKLIIYNNLLKDIRYEIKGYSFISSNSSNGLSIITKNENKILLCACKQYKKYQKNGILLVNVKLEEKEKIRYFYYDTGKFEVYCFCQIYILDKTNNKILDENKITIATDYFLVGGFDKNKGRGIIKLYKIIENKTFLESKIEYIQDIEIEKKENFKGFKGPITSIIQTERNGDLLVTCWDGNVYLLEKPNIELFLFYDNLKN